MATRQIRIKKSEKPSYSNHPKHSVKKQLTSLVKRPFLKDCLQRYKFQQRQKAYEEKKAYELSKKFKPQVPIPINIQMVLDEVLNNVLP